MSNWVSFIPDANHQGADPRLAGGRLTINLNAVAENYRFLATMASPARVAAVLKADAYGLGAGEVGRTLWRAGCKSFFVALPEEGVALRAVLPQAEIFVLNGLFGPEAAPVYGAHRLLPVLGSQSDIACWEAHGWDADMPRPCAIHVDTGMNRLGLRHEEALSFVQDNALTRAITPRLLMSHLTCGNERTHPANSKQLETVRMLRQVFPGVEISLANSAGIFLGPDFIFDLVRPGIALYGGAPVKDMENPMKSVVTAEARVIQLRHAKTGETVSYGGSQTLSRDTMIAVASVGYADGYHRSGSATGVPLRQAVAQGAFGFLRGQRVPILGRVTMDLTLFDVTELGEGAVVPGDWIELFGTNIPIDEAAHAAGTISYELLTSLGRRFYRYYHMSA